MEIEPNEPMKYASWLSPGGYLYSCPREGHYYLAQTLCLHFGIETSSPGRCDEDDQLLRLGWLKIAADGYVFDARILMKVDDAVVTKAQMETMQAIVDTPWTEDPPDVIMQGYGDKYIHGDEETWNIRLKRAMYRYEKFGYIAD